MTTTFLIREVNDVADVCNSVDTLVGGCLGGRVSDRELLADTGEEYKWFSLKGSKQELFCKAGVQGKEPWRNIMFRDTVLFTPTCFHFRAQTTDWAECAPSPPGLEWEAVCVLEGSFPHLSYFFLVWGVECRHFLVRYLLLLVLPRANSFLAASR